jgi:Na+/H+ antiporter NhaC
LEGSNSRFSRCVEFSSLVINGLVPWNPKSAFFLYSYDFSSKNVFVYIKTYLFPKQVFAGFLCARPFWSRWPKTWSDHPLRLKCLPLRGLAYHGEGLHISSCR